MLRNTPFIFVTQCRCRLQCKCTILYIFHVSEPYSLTARTCVVTLVCSKTFVHLEEFVREFGPVKMPKQDHTLLVDRSQNPNPEQQLSNHSLATIAQHTRSVKLWISTHVEAVYMGLVQSLEGGVKFFPTFGQPKNTRAKVKEQIKQYLSVLVSLILA